MNEGAQRPRPVLIVEDRADDPCGHYPRRFAELAEAYSNLGHHVEVSTARGWLHESEHRKDAGTGFVVHRYGPLALSLHELADRMRGLRRFGIAGSAVRGSGQLLWLAVMIGRARGLRDRVVDPPADMIVLSAGVHPVLAAGLAGRGRWLLYVFGSTDRWRPAMGAVARVVRVIERRRRARGGFVRVATPDDASRRDLATLVPFLDPVVLPIAGCRDLCIGARGGAQPAQGAQVPAGGERTALLFGSGLTQDAEVVWQAFSELEGWRLVLGGQVADRCAGLGWPGPALPPVCRGGFVSDADRDRLYAAADLVVLSFGAGYWRNSGTLMDAIAFGVPVACSDRSQAAEVVREHGLGVVFAAGDVRSLITAVRAAPQRIREEDLEGARAQWSNRSVASRHLRLLDGTAP